MILLFPVFGIASQQFPEPFDCHKFAVKVHIRLTRRMKNKKPRNGVFIGGEYRSRTDDLLHAMQAL